MKLQSLVIHNIASIADAMVDFQAEPLVSCDLFLISGPTGSGKTTILDSICLALYNRVPRFENSRMRGDVDTPGYDDAINAADTRNLLRRSAGEGYVRLTFTADDGVHYQADWTVRRARDKATGKFQKLDWQLTNLDTGRTTTGMRQVALEIEQAVGLNFNRFCRTCLLAQGDFSRFLNSSDDDKSALLEQITGVGSFTLIGQRIFESFRQKEELHKEKHMLLSAIKLLSDEEIAQREKEKSEIAARLKTIREQFDSISAKLHWLSRLSELEAALAKAGSEEEFRRRFISIMAEIAAIERRYAGLMQLDEQNNEAVKAREKQVPLYEQERLVVDRLKRRDSIAREINALQQQIARRQQLREAKLQELTGMRQSLDAVRSQAAAAAECLTQQQQLVEKLNMQQLYDSRAKVNDRIAAIRNLATAVDAYLREQQRLEGLVHDSEVAAEELKQLNDEKTALDRQLIVDKAVEANSHKLYEKVRVSNEIWVSECRHKLDVGDRCPLCLQEIHDVLPNNETIYLTNIKPIEEEYEKARAATMANTRKLSALSGHHEAKTKEAKRLERTVTELRQTLAGSLKAISAELPKYGIEDINDTRQIAGRIQQEAAGQIQQLNAEIDKANELNKAIAAQQQEISAIDKSEKQWTKDIAAAENTLHKYDAADESDLKIIDSKHSEDSAAARWLEDIFASAGWDTSGYADRAALCKAVQQQSTEYRSMVEAGRQSQLKLNTLATTLKSLRTAAENIHIDIGPDSLPEVECGDTTEVETALAQLGRDMAARETLVSQLARHKVHRPEFADDDTGESLKQQADELDRQRDALSRRTGSIEDELLQDRERRQQSARLRSEVESLYTEYTRWKRLRDMFGSRDGKKFRNIAQSYVLGHLTELANRYMATLMPRYRLRMHPSTFIIMVEDLQQSGSLRPANGISGGESFVVSLALALALSDMSGRHNMDMLFIDEGFGTLSGEPLVNAVETLRNLHGGNRRVGIISHIEELREWIDVKISVTQQGRGGVSTITIA